MFTSEAHPASDTDPEDTEPKRCAGSLCCRSKLSPWQESRFLTSYNEYRAHHGACPLTYSSTISDYTVGSSGFRDMCTTEDITDGNNASDLATQGYSEFNVAIDDGLDNLYEYDLAKANFLSYCLNEACYSYSTNDFAEKRQKAKGFTNMVWKASTEIGCGVCHRRTLGKASMMLMCHTKVPTNVVTEMAANVLAVGTAAVCTGTTNAPVTLPPLPPLPPGTTAPVPTSATPAPTDSNGFFGDLSYLENMVRSLFRPVITFFPGFSTNILKKQGVKLSNTGSNY